MRRTDAEGAKKGAEDAEKGKGENRNEDEDGIRERDGVGVRPRRFVNQ